MRVLCGAILVAVLGRVPAGSAQERQFAAQPAGGFVASDTPEALLQHADVQKELKLSSRQVQKINEVIGALREKHKKDFDKLQALGPDERRRKQADLTKIVSQETMSALTGVLEPAQVKRLEQIHLQQEGLKAFLDPKVEKALQLTDDQKNKLKVIRDDAAKEIRMLFRGGPRSNFQQALKDVEKIRSNAVEKSVTLLSPEQKKVWKERLGQPFRSKAEPPLIRGSGAEPGNPGGGKP